MNKLTMNNYLRRKWICCLSFLLMNLCSFSFLQAQASCDFTVTCPPAQAAVPCGTTIPTLFADLGGSYFSTCGTVTESFEDLFTVTDCAGSFTRLYTLTSENITESCFVDIEFFDTTLPDLSIPVDLTISCDADPLDLTLTGTATATDNCDTDVAIAMEDSFVPSCGQTTGTITRAWTALDNCGNFTVLNQIITLEDTEAPTFTAPLDVVLNCGDDATDLTLTGGPDNLADNCSDIITSTFVDIPIIGSCADDILRTWTIHDGCGNTVEVGQNISFDDSIAPEITCPAPLAIELAPGLCEQVVTWDDATATDLCSPTVSVVQIAGPAKGSVLAYTDSPWTVTYQATDLCNNTTECSFEISMVDYQGDWNFACNNHLNISLDAQCEAYIDASLVLQGTTYPCYDRFDVELFADEAMTQPLNINASNDLIDGSFIGETVVFSVSLDGNSCWGTLLIEDKIDPTISCDGLDAEYSCADLDALLDGSLDAGTPVTADNCGPLNLLPFVDSVEEIDCQGSVITRDWTVADAYGNTASCSQTITLTNPSIGDLTLPGTIELECGSEGNISPAGLAAQGYSEAYPYLTTASGVYPLAPTLCNLGATYTDLPAIDLCAGTYKIIRNWIIVDWCEEGQLTHTQVIKILDTTAPVIDCPANIEISTASPYTCDAAVPVPHPTIIEACSDDVTVSVQTPEGEITLGDGTQTFTAGPGSYDLVYTATDECGNISETCTTTVTVYDGWGPVAICDQNTVVSLDGEGWAQICAATFDDGSYDACEDVVIKVKRMDASAITPFEDCIDFSCGDLTDGCEGLVQVRMRVYDIAGNYSENDPNARFNECMVNVTVQDKLGPQIVCPEDKTVDCMGDYSSVEGLSDTDGAGLAPVYLEGALIGYYPVVDNCDNATIELTVFENIDNCGEGFATQTWTVTDACDRSSTCSNTITVVRSNTQYFTGDDVNNDDDNIVWPANELELNCEAVAIDGELVNTENTGEPILQGTEDDCATLYVGHNDEILYDDPDACYKILRTWKVIDWCQYDTNNPYSGGIWTYLQVIKVNDYEAPEFISDCSSIRSVGDDDGDCQEEVTLTAEATDNCSTVTYTWAIDAYYDGSIDYTGTGNDASNSFPFGTHSITFTATDECGNESTCSYLFEVYDDKKPTPVCIVSLSTVIMPSSGQIEIWATDFDASSFDDCSNPIDLRLNSVAIIDGEPVYLTAAPAAASVTFDCTQVGEQLIQMWVVDDAGNADYCVTSIFIQDPNNTCGLDPLADLAGYIATEEDEMVDQVTIEVVGGNGDAFVTDNDGFFNFNGLPINTNYVVAPEKDMDYLNGVTTFDLVLISQHILGINNLDSPYKMIAADANNSGSITTFDLVTLRRLVLNIDTELSNNDSWRFVDQDFVFPTPTNPWATTFPEVINFNNFSSSDMAADFVAVKVGDVNGTAVPNNLVGSESRTAGQMLFDVADQFIAKGETFTVDFNANDFNEVLGYQFTIAFDEGKMNFVDVTPATSTELTTNNFGLTNLEDGVITTSWNMAKSVNVNDGEAIFSLTFEATEAITLSEVIRINSQSTKAEAYRANDLNDVAINFNGKEGSAVQTTTFELFQNTPNPSQGVTSIGFILPEAAPATLTITDVNGRLMMKLEGDFAKGYNELIIGNSNELNNGIFYYNLQSGEFNATKKMLIVK